MKDLPKVPQNYSCVCDVLPSSSKLRLTKAGLAILLTNGGREGVRNDPESAPGLTWYVAWTVEHSRRS